MKGEGAEPLFKLRRDQTPEESRAGDEALLREVAHAASFLAGAPYAGIAEAIGALAFDLADMRASAVGAFALNAETLESISRAGEQMRGAVAGLMGPDSPFAQSVRLARQTVLAFGARSRAIAEETQAALDAWAASLSEEEREEIRRACADAPLEPVDVNASDAGAM